MGCLGHLLNWLKKRERKVERERLQLSSSYCHYWQYYFIWKKSLDKEGFSLISNKRSSNKFIHGRANRSKPNWRANCLLSTFGLLDLSLTWSPVNCHSVYFVTHFHSTFSWAKCLLLFKLNWATSFSQSIQQLTSIWQFTFGQLTVVSPWSLCELNFSRQTLSHLPSAHLLASDTSANIIQVRLYCKSE